MIKDLPEGQTHSFGDGCGEKEHNPISKKCCLLCSEFSWRKCESCPCHQPKPEMWECQSVYDGNKNEVVDCTCGKCADAIKPSPASTKEINVKRWQILVEQMSKLGIAEWASQGRTDEQVYGVKNFLTGLGGSKILDLLSSHDQQLRQRIVEEGIEVDVVTSGSMPIVDDSGHFIIAPAGTDSKELKKLEKRGFKIRKATLHFITNLK